MKRTILVLLAASAYAAEFVTGQAARAVIGQRTFTDGSQGADQNLIGGVGGVAYANNMLFVADGNRVGAAPVNQRVLIFKNVSGFLPQPTDVLQYTTPCPVCVGNADVVLGQPDFTTTNTAVSQTSFRTPSAVASDGTVIAVADSDNNRVLIWNQIPTSNGVPADVVVGQPNFTTGSIPPGNIPSAKSMRGPSGRLDSEREAVRRRYPEPSHHDFQFDPQAERRGGGSGAGSTEFDHHRPAGSDQGR